ncbi:aminotransferase class V-fold PLP-dependent enzyme [Alicyclobacillus ferrooxydans]|uniref:Selenocysteine lyase n=1 Tax=Alicyclobacillus ferrooxydans TaxID=471514 RepID=A0A0P9ETM8_9BACL|nr:aminotransferase class V-fold PLP-dependent enzyme [Alicyclobacillus ferrooxydans]KPV42220.1 selenocysteine lyase [Alicyclobacillus ferrooxydans]
MSSDAFHDFRRNTIGYNQPFHSPYGRLRMIYADWTATGRLYRPVEEVLLEKFAPFMGNTHSQTSMTGSAMSDAYGYASNYIKSRVGANADDLLIPTGTGATSAINKLQRILGLRVHEKSRPYTHVPEELKPVIFVTHMEHHSNHTSWLETIGDVVCLPPGPSGLVEPGVLRAALDDYRDRPMKIGSFTACSNVTGILTPYYELAKVMHEQGGVCFVDFAASAPYVPINMHPNNPAEQLDAIFFSPHKFLGGPGSPGILIFNSRLYANTIPDQPGGGTVKWTNPWGGRSYVNDIETREDGGTPGILQLIKAAFAFMVKDELLAANMLHREREITTRTLSQLKQVPRLEVLDGQFSNRLSIFSFYFPHLHYNLVVRLLNDRFGIQSRGGCSCAGTYGHYLLHIDPEASKRIMDNVEHNDLSEKPGWVRVSLHPMMKDDEISFILYALDQVSTHGTKWAKDYSYNAVTNEFEHKYAATPHVSSLFQMNSQGSGVPGFQRPSNSGRWA